MRIPIQLPLFLDHPVSSNLKTIVIPDHNSRSSHSLSPTGTDLVVVVVVVIVVVIVATVFVFVVVVGMTRTVDKASEFGDETTENPPLRRQYGLSGRG